MMEKIYTNNENILLLDVRSPSEFNHAHIPHAYNLPLFSDDERAIVGTAYKKQSKELAIKIGMDFFGPKMRPMVEEVENLLRNKYNIKVDENFIPQDYKIHVQCWRGGMRSGAVAWLLGLYGFQVELVKGGYKAYRNWVLEQFTLDYDLKILGGYTGSKKTAILHSKKQAGETIIDLENLACHKGSSFGHIAMPPQPSQELFENILAHELFTKKDSTIWLEDECQRLGHVFIPPSFWKSMSNAAVEMLDISFDQRLSNIVCEYGVLDKIALIEAVLRIQKRLGGLNTKTVIDHINNDNIKDAFSILLFYYDKAYDNKSIKIA